MTRLAFCPYRILTEFCVWVVCSGWVWWFLQCVFCWWLSVVLCVCLHRLALSELARQGGECVIVCSQEGGESRAELGLVVWARGRYSSPSGESTGGSSLRHFFTGYVRWFGW